MRALFRLLGDALGAACLAFTFYILLLLAAGFQP